MFSWKWSKKKTDFDIQAHLIPSSKPITGYHGVPTMEVLHLSFDDAKRALGELVNVRIWRLLTLLPCLPKRLLTQPTPFPPLTRVPPLLLTLPPLKIHGRLSAQGSQFGSNPGRPPYTIVIRDTGLLPMHPARCLKVKIVASWGRSWVISKSRNKISNLGPRCPGVNNCASHISSRFYSLRSCHCALQIPPCHHDEKELFLLSAFAILLICIFLLEHTVSITDMSFF